MTENARTARIRTDHAAPRVVAAALAADNTDEIDTETDEGCVVTTVERERASGLRSTVDDYLVNVDVADRTVSKVTQHTTQP
jgi:tRNA threonylcarbamoyladenosine modification (KEOPS) complex  Pcc1 subunit